MAFDKTAAIGKYQLDPASAQRLQCLQESRDALRFVERRNDDRKRGRFSRGPRSAALGAHFLRSFNAQS